MATRLLAMKSIKEFYRPEPAVQKNSLIIGHIGGDRISCGLSKH